MPTQTLAGAFSHVDVNHYAVLGLQSPGTAGSPPSASTEQIKAAYRRALLRYHPDKLSRVEAREVNADGLGSNANTNDASPPTMDQVRAALTVLTTPVLRREHDLKLQTAGGAAVTTSRAAAQSTAAQRTTELDVLDLDDLEFDSKTGVYFRACRCGNARGFAVAEDDLVDGEDPDGTSRGEVLLECPDCSHHLRVTFSFVLSDGDE